MARSYPQRARSSSRDPESLCSSLEQLYLGPNRDTAGHQTRGLSKGIADATYVWRRDLYASNVSFDDFFVVAHRFLGTRDIQ